MCAGNSIHFRLTEGWKYHQSSLSHELQAMDCTVKVVVFDTSSCMMGWRCQATNHHINKWGSGTAYSSFNELTYDGNHESLYQLPTKISHQVSKTQKSEGTHWVELTIGDSNSTLVYNDSKHLASSLTEIEPHTAMANQPEESKETLATENNIRKVTRNSKISKNTSKDRDSNFLAAFSSSKA